MPREGIDYPGWFNRAACSIRCELSKLWSAVGTKLSKINTVEPDGDGKVKIVSDSATLTVTDDQSNNAVRLELDAGLSNPPVDSVNGQTGTVVLETTDIAGDGNVYDGTSIQTMNSVVKVLFNLTAQGAKAGDDALRTRMTAAESAITTETNTRIAEDALLQSALNGKADTGDSYTKQESDARYADVATPHTWAELQTFDDGIDVNGDADVSGDLDVDGTADLDDANVSGALLVSGLLTGRGGALFNQSSGGSYASANNLRMQNRWGEILSGYSASAPMIVWIDKNEDLQNFINSIIYGTGYTGLVLNSIDTNGNVVSYRVSGLPEASKTSSDLTSVGYVSNTGGTVNNLLHTNGNESFTGIKTGSVTNYGTAFRTKISSIDVTNPPSSETLGNITFCDTNNVSIVTIRAGYSSTGRVVIGLTLRNNDGTNKYITLGTADN